MPNHGGDIYTHQGVLDFSANINPLGLPQGVKDVLLGSAELLCAYPDPLCRDLKRALADRHGVPPAHICCANGAADIIFALCFANMPKRALLLAPTFAEYEQALGAVNCEIRYHLLQEQQDFALTEAILQDITPDTDIVFLCNPNNPTGCIAPRALVLQIMQACKQAGAWLMVDECFTEFLDEGDQVSVIDALSCFDNVLVLKAFTKLYAMAGLRLGYSLCSNDALNAKLDGVRQPWSVSTLAQLSGVAALRETQYVAQTQALIQAQRAYLKLEISRRANVYGSFANYIFFRAQPGLKEAMLEQAILIRSCANYTGLDEHFYRVAVKSAKDNAALIAALDIALDRINTNGTNGMNGMNGWYAG